MSQVWQIGEAVRHIDEPSSRSPYPGQDALETVLNHLSMIGVNDGAVGVIRSMLENPVEGEVRVLMVGSTLSMNIHPALQLAFTLGWSGCEGGVSGEAKDIVIGVARNFEVEWLVEAYLADISAMGSEPEERRCRTEGLIKTLSEWN